MKKNEILRVNNNTKVIAIYQRDFENMSQETERKISLYENRGYNLVIEDNPRKVGAGMRITESDILRQTAPFVSENGGLGLTEEESKKFVEVFRQIKNLAKFPKARSFFFDYKKNKELALKKAELFLLTMVVFFRMWI